MKEKRNKFYNVLISIMYFFRQSIYYLNPANGYFLVGNLDAFYLLAPLYIVKKIRKIKKETLIFIGFSIGYLLIQIILIRDLNIMRAIINVSKIIVCYFVMKYIIENHQKINLKLISNMFSILCILLLIISFIFPNSILWRHNDTINKYDLNRLQFLYTEPSELGFHAIIILILWIYLIVNSKNFKKVILYITLSIPIIVVLFYTKSLGAIGVGAISIVVLCLADFILNYSKKKLLFYIILVTILTMILCYMIINENSLYLRIRDTLQGKDVSNNYRIFIPYRVCANILYDTGGIGIGFGNAELEENVSKYRDLGLEKAGIINSYMNLISESGILGIIMVLTINTKLLKKSFQEKSMIKIALSTFIILYQFLGTYFTNPLCWIIYGIILSDDFNIQEISKEKRQTGDLTELVQ